MEYEKTYLVQNAFTGAQDNLTIDEVIDQAQYWVGELLSDQQNNSANEKAHYLNQKALLDDTAVNHLSKIEAAREILEIININVY